MTGSQIPEVSSARPAMADYRRPARDDRSRVATNAPQAARARRMRPKQPYFEIRRSPIQGKGAFALRRIRAGTRIIEYTGEHISYEESDRRYDDAKMSRHHTFLFILDDETIIDAAVGGNDARFINHSCDPNCEAIIERGHIYIYAKRNIQPGVELAYDYKYEREGNYDEGDEAFYVCKCGSPKCRGTILAPKRRRRKKRRGAKKSRGR